MNVEQLDGFFAALMAGPETVMPSEYYPEVFGGEMSDACEFGSLDQANEILALLMRHWNDIAGTLFKDEVCVPLLLQDEDGVANGNDWAHGFMRGMGMRCHGWAELVNDEEHGRCLIPMMMLCHEHDEDPEMRPKPISPQKREEVIVHMAAGLLQAYRYFRAQRQAYAGTTFTHEPRRTSKKVGRNDPCLCGSGKKYKKCCGGATLNQTPDRMSSCSSGSKERRRTLQVVKTISVPPAPQEVVTRPDGQVAYVSCDHSHQGAAIQINNWGVKLIDAGSGADGLAWAK